MTSDTRVEYYNATGRDFLERARAYLDDGDLLQASEKGWGAAAQMVKAVAETRGWRHQDHRSLYGVVNRLASEAGDVDISTAVGAISAYFGGVVDTLLMRLADIMIMMPAISVLVVLSALIGVEHFELALIIGILSGFGGTGVVLKSQALSVVSKPYVEAARIAGGGPFHIILVHVVPNLLPLSFLYMMFTVTSAIFSEAVLSFLGLLDVRMSWGLMIHTTESAGYLLQVGEYWWLIFPASLSITLLCSSFYLVGRALDEVINPRLRSR